MEKINELYSEFPDIEIFKILSELHYKFVNEDISLDPTPLVDLFKIDKTKQQDICEFLSFFLNYVIEKLPNERRHELSDFINCKLTTSISEVSDNVFFYTIPVNANVSVKDMIYSSLTQLDAKFATKPTLLFIQLQRMLYNKSTNTFYKIKDAMEIPLDLDLTNYNALNYQLFAVVEHIGSGNAGHYRVCLRDDEGWLMASDRRVTAITLKEVMETSNSEYSPAYLLCFVSDLENDIFSKRTKLIQTDDDNYITPVNQLRDLSTFGTIKCAFHPPNNPEKLEYHPEIIEKIIVITQFFDQMKMEFHEPEKNNYHSIGEIQDMIDIYKSDETTFMQFGFLNEIFEDDLPKEVGHYDIPLYILFQNSSFRIFKSNPYQYNKIIHVKYIQKYVGLTFDCFFAPSQIFSDINKYATVQMQNLFGSRQDYVCYLQYFNNYYINISNLQYKIIDVVNMLDLNVSQITDDKGRSSFTVYFIETKMKDEYENKFIKTKKIQFYDQSKPTEETKTISYPLRLLPSRKHFTKLCDSLDFNFAVVGMKSETSYFIFEDNHINPKLFYETEDIRLINKFNKEKTALFAVYYQDVYIQTFFFDVEDSFEETKEKLKPFMQFKDFNLFFYLEENNDDFIADQNPKELIKAFPNGFFKISSIETDHI